MSAKTKHTEKALKQFINEVVNKSRANIIKKRKNASGNLSKSIKGDYKVFPNSFSLSFEMEDYGEFQDKGVKGAKSSKKAPNSPFKFGTGSAPQGKFKGAIDKWVVRKGIAPRGAGGQFQARQQLVKNIMRSIYNTGIKPSLFFTEAFEKSFNGLDEQIIEAYGLDVETFLKFALNGKTS